MLQKGASGVTERTLGYKKDIWGPFCNKICYKKDPEMLHKGTPMLQKGHFVTKRMYVVLSVTKQVTKRILKCYIKED